MYKYNQLLEVVNKFKEYFDTPFKPFMENMISMITKQIKIDIVKFDEWLGTPDGVSTRQFITEKYGKEACAFIEELL